VSCRTLIVGVTALALYAPCICAQDAKPAPPHAQVILTKLGTVAYPLIAKTAHIEGDVTIEVSIRQDGSIESATAIDGPALLYRVALTSAQQSQFECRNCSDVTLYRMVYSFHLVYPKLSSEEQNECFKTYKAQITPKIVLAGNHVVFTDAGEVYVDCVISFHVRSWKCFYLWRCGRTL
jgi:hypothetical protein